MGTLAVLALLVASLLAFGFAVRAAVSPGAPVVPSVVELLPGTGLDEDDGLLPSDEIVTVFDDELPAVGNLDADLLGALRAAAADAADDGVTFQVNSGWRSADYQQSLLEDAIDEHGSREEAARWVATAETSSHVTGDAIDLGPTDATSWLAQHGQEYGLCRTYANEPWHYELRSGTPDQGCPVPYADPTEDPRLSS
ncbi:peptidase M15 [Brachybacterium sp. P6-10-X1]|nr:peptidase M15 [Brachybacterium sp. P6-10-X1]